MNVNQNHKDHSFIIHGNGWTDKNEYFSCWKIKTQDLEIGGPFLNQSGLLSKFQDSQNYTARPFFKLNKTEFISDNYFFIFSRYIFQANKSYTEMASQEKS